VALEAARGWKTAEKANTASGWIEQHVLWKGVCAAGDPARVTHWQPLGEDMGFTFLLQ